MDAPFNWTCPHCGRDTTISDHNCEKGNADFNKGGSDGRQRLSWEFIVCPNRKCGKFTIACKLRSYELVAVGAPLPPTSGIGQYKAGQEEKAAYDYNAAIDLQNMSSSM